MFHRRKCWRRCDHPPRKHNARLAALWTLLRLPLPNLPTARLPRSAILTIVGLGFANWLYLILTH